MKKYFICSLIAVTLMFFAGCGSGVSEPDDTENTNPVPVKWDNAKWDKEKWK